MRNIQINGNVKRPNVLIDDIAVNNDVQEYIVNTADKKAEKLAKELEKATNEKEKAEIRNKYAYGIEKTESKLTYAYNGYIDVEYTLVGNKLKESLIIKKQTGKLLLFTGDSTLDIPVFPQKIPQPHRVFPAQIRQSQHIHAVVVCHHGAGKQPVHIRAG